MPRCQRGQSQSAQILKTDHGGQPVSDFWFHIEVKMNARVLLFVVLFVGVVSFFAVETKAQADSPAQLQIEAIATNLASGGIEKIEILQIPIRILTRTRITPEMLERQFQYKLTIRDIRGSAYQSGMTAALKTEIAEPTTDMSDIRWGIMFYGSNDVRLGSLYFDGSGHSGVVDRTPVSFKGQFFGWLEGNFSKSFQ